VVGIAGGRCGRVRRRGRYFGLPVSLLRPDRGASSSLEQINDTLLTLYELNELAESHTIMADNAEFGGVTADEVEAAREHLALLPRVVEMIAGKMAGWVVPGEPSPAPAIRAGLYARHRAARSVALPVRRGSALRRRGRRCYVT
jgi:hypothetical protein